MAHSSLLRWLLLPVLPPPPTAAQFNCSQIWELGVAGHMDGRSSSPCSCDCRSPCPFTSCPFVHEPPSAGILNLFAVSGQGNAAVDGQNMDLP